MKNPMEQLKALHNRYSGILTANEVAVYFQLFMLGNQRYWPDWIEIADWQLSLAANISAKALPVVINSLVQKGLIEANRCRGKVKSGYKINPLDKDGRPLSNYTQNDLIKQKYHRDKTEIKQEYNRNITEIKQKYEPETPCGSKADGTPKTQHNTTQHNKDNKKEIQKKKAVDVFASCAESDRVKAALSDFDEMRKKMRAPMTNKAKEILLSKLDELSGGDEFMKVHLLEQSIENGWKSIYPLKQNLSTKQSTGNPQNPQDAIDRAIEYFQNQEEGQHDEGRSYSESY